MARRPRTVPRKLPRQERSRATVEAILAATAHILVREGYDRASTNRIAAAAGISVGSLYQYFPSKEALVAALVDQHASRLMDTFRTALAEAGEEDLGQSTRELIRAMVRAHRIDPALHRVLSDQIPRVGRLERVDALNKEAQALLRARLAPAAPLLRPRNLDLAAFILNRAVEAVTHGYVQGALEGVDEEELVNELCALVVGYLAPAGA